MKTTPKRRIGAALIFLGVVVATSLLGYVPWALSWLYLGLSALSFIVYAIDKRAAGHNRRRTPESTLHTLALSGGWPGALIAQETLRHKTRKQPFRRVFWLSVIGNLAGVAALLSPAADQWVPEWLLTERRVTPAMQWTPG